MLKISGNDIYLTRGDSGRLVVSVLYASGEDFQPAETDQLVLTVKRDVHELNPLLQKCTSQWSAGGRAEIELRPEDSKELAFGAYVYDVELRTATGEVYTIITPSGLRICEEVS